MGWSFPVLFVALALFGLWRLAALPRAALQLAAAAMAIAVIGYAWQGSPNVPSAPAALLAEAPLVDTSSIKAHPLKAAFTREEMALNAADALVRAHNSAGAVSLLQDELKGSERNPDLWVGLGNALVAHADGVMSPAAEFAFNRAAVIAPLHPGPALFRGLAAAQVGRFDEARAQWQALLARTPADAPWRKDLEAKLATLAAMQTGK